MLVRSLLTTLGFDVNPRGMQRYENGLKNVISTTMRLSAVTATAIAALGTLFFKGAGEIEQIEVAFETMLGSAEAAKKLLLDITRFAEKTPFQLMEVTKASKQLLAFGIAGDKIIETMTNLGNISAGIGRDKLGTLVRAFGKIRTKGRASMEELNMMLEAGVPIMDELAKTMKMKVGPELFNLVEKGVVNFELVNKSIKAMANGTGKFADLMIKQSKTLLGLISNIKDVFTNLINSIGKDLLPEGKRLSRLFLQWITLNKRMIKINIAKFYTKLLKIIQDVVAVFNKFKIIGNIGDFLRFLISVLRIFGDVVNRVFLKDGESVISFLARWIKENRKLIATNIVKFIRGLADVFEILLRVVKSVGSLVFELALLLIDTFGEGGAAVLGKGLINTANNFLKVADSITATLKAIREAEEGEKGAAVGKGLLGTVGALGGLLQGILQTFAEISDMVINPQSTAMGNFLYEIEKELWKLQRVVDIIFGRIGLTIESVFSNAFDIINKKLAAFSEFLDNLLLGVTNLLDKFTILGAIKPKVGPSNNKGGSNNTLIVEAVVNVPPGTPEEQIAVVQQGSEDVFKEIMKKLNRNNNAALAAMEGF